MVECHKFVSLFAFTLVALAVSSNASAGSVNGEFIGISPRRVVGIHLDGYFHGNVYAGVNVWEGDDGSTMFEGEQFKAFCIEIRQHLADPTTFTTKSLEESPVPSDYPESESGNGMGADRANDIRELWHVYFNQIGDNADYAAAFQLAVWELVYEDRSEPGDTWSVDDGRFYMYGSKAPNARALANTWLDDIQDNDYDKANLIALTSLNNQDMVTMVPLPAAAGMGMLGFAFVVWRRRRRLV